MKYLSIFKPQIMPSYWHYR